MEESRERKIENTKAPTLVKGEGKCGLRYSLEENFGSSEEQSRNIQRHEAIYSELARRITGMTGRYMHQAHDGEVSISLQ